MIAASFAAPTVPLVLILTVVIFDSASPLPSFSLALGVYAVCFIFTFCYGLPAYLLVWFFSGTVKFKYIIWLGMFGGFLVRILIGGPQRLLRLSGDDYAVILLYCALGGITAVAFWYVMQVSGMHLADKLK